MILTQKTDLQHPIKIRKAVHSDGTIFLSLNKIPMLFTLLLDNLQNICCSNNFPLLPVLLDCRNSEQLKKYIKFEQSSVYCNLASTVIGKGEVIAACPKPSSRSKKKRKIGKITVGAPGGTV